MPILASTAYVVELSFVPLVLPSLQTEFGLTRAALAWIFNAYVAAVAIGVLVGGRLGDGIGPQRIFAMGVVLFVAGSIFVGMSDAQGAIIVGRVVQGFGGGLFSPVIPVLLARAAAPRPGRLLILWGSISGLVAGLAPLAAHYFLGAFGWELVFYGLAGLALPALFSGFFMRIEGEAESEPGHRVSLMAALRQPARVWSLYGYVFCNFGTIMLFIFLLPLSLDEAGYRTIDQAWIMLVFWAVFAAAGVVLRNAIDGQAIWWVLAASPVLVLGGYCVFLAALPSAWVVIAAALIGVGFACGNATSTTLILRYCIEGTSSMAASLDISIARLGVAMVIAIAAPFELASVVGLVAALCLATALFAVAPSPLFHRKAAEVNSA
ncbi:MFS transporter [Candidatus Rhodobacter oscarellae]|uniref:MFS transporter n=1 Tax=Candidatus Rhodobacter oscarellae TaxID=1675527 RepID=UPI0006714264|nr:MFS transporter [Candidatus Rhodobacter lobularis]